MPKYNKKIMQLIRRYDFIGIIFVLGVTILSALIIGAIFLFLIWLLNEFVKYLAYRESWI